MKKNKIAIIVGSLRKASFNRKLANELIRIQPESLEMQIVEIGDLPLYNEDLEGDNPPKAWTDFRHAMQQVDGVLFITPEYNRSIPGGLKNAIDVGSRPYGKSVWQGKRGAVISVTPGALGAFGANHVLRQSMVFLNVPMMQQPEAYISNIATLFDENNHLTEGIEKFMKSFLDAYAQWI